MNAEVKSQNPPAQPAVRGGLVAYLQVKGATRASQFYQRAFGATEVARHPVDEQGRTMHARSFVRSTAVR